MRKHALLNAIVPGIQVIALQLAWLAGGVVIVEYLFSYPGIGRQLVDSVRNQRRPDGAGAEHDHRRGLRGGEPDRRHPVHPVHPASEDGDLVMSVISPANAPAASASQPQSWLTGLVITLLHRALRHLRPAVRALRRERDRRHAVHQAGLLLGTDYLGQDVWSRVLYGGPAILIIAVLGHRARHGRSGIVIGVVAAYGGGWRDEVIMRLNDVALAFPQILLALLVLTAVDQPACVDDRVAGRRLARAACRPAGPRRGAGHRLPRLRHRGRGARRERLPGDPGRGAAQHERAAAGRGRAAADLLDRPRRAASASWASPPTPARPTGAR